MYKYVVMFLLMFVVMCDGSENGESTEFGIYTITTPDYESTCSVENSTITVELTGSYGDLSKCQLQTKFNGITLTVQDKVMEDETFELDVYASEKEPIEFTVIDSAGVEKTYFVSVYAKEGVYNRTLLAPQIKKVLFGKSTLYPEYIEITNYSTVTIALNPTSDASDDISILKNGAGGVRERIFTFPEGATLAPNETVTVMNTKKQTDELYDYELENLSGHTSLFGSDNGTLILVKGETETGTILDLLSYSYYDNTPGLLIVLNDSGAVAFRTSTEYVGASGEESNVGDLWLTHGVVVDNNRDIAIERIKTGSYFGHAGEWKTVTEYAQ